jgi:hypothetical protein
MAAAVEDNITITDGVKIDTDKMDHDNIIRRAYSEIGGVPKNHLKTTATKVGATAWRVNIYVAVPTDSFVKSAEIQHSFYFKS